ncbi:NAD(P)H-binding protein [Limosilactobacillus antri]|uniref:NAD(P)H-binding protein n=1 Tax=Limosilactobacillus antri TaxID=227943 RepID=UPI001F55F9DD|nr:NAD(P)H-binding protein [Limosilactobacillus antri]
MGRTIIVSRRHDRLGQLTMKKMYDAVAVSGPKLNFQQGDQLCWLPEVSEPVDEEVQALVAQIDQAVFTPQKIVMLSMAGTADDASLGQLQRWYGKGAQEYLWAHQYAIKMIDELELPYTVIRALPLTTTRRPAVITSEGQAVTGQGVSEETLAGVIEQALLTDRYRNQSIGVSAKEED